MKLHPFFSILVLLAVTCFVQSCSEDTEIEEMAEPCHTQIFSDDPISQDLTCDPGLSFPLIVEGTSQVGTVRITPVNGAYKVSYITTGDWLIHKVSIFAGPPQNLRTRDDCSPILDPLAYTSSLETADNSYGIGFYEYSVDTCFHFITTAEVSKSSDIGSETELAIANTGNRLSGNQTGWYGVLCKSSCVTEIPLPSDCPVFP